MSSHQFIGTTKDLLKISYFFLFRSRYSKCIVVHFSGFSFYCRKDTHMMEKTWRNIRKTAFILLLPLLLAVSKIYLSNINSTTELFIFLIEYHSFFINSMKHFGTLSVNFLKLSSLAIIIEHHLFFFELIL